MNLFFLIKPFFYNIKKSRQKFKYLRRKKAFEMKQKAFFINFQGFSVAKNCIRPEAAFLIILDIKRGILCNVTKKLLLMGHSGTGFKFSFTIDL